MEFDSVPVDDALDARSAYTIRTNGFVLKKGNRFSAHAIRQLKCAGIQKVVAVRLEPGDIDENEAALRLADVVAGENVSAAPPFRGRSNLIANTPGVLVLARHIIDAVNAVDEGLTVATLHAFKPVSKGEMVGTIKIIPYSVPEARLSDCIHLANTGPSAVRVAPYIIHNVGVISTLLPKAESNTVDKTLRVLSGRLQPSQATISIAAQVAHDPTALADELVRQGRSTAELIIVFGASSIVDRRDVVPAALVTAGGHIEHFGMPVEPGSLLLIGSIAGKPVIGAPGCARSPSENGFDWVLHRILADVPVTRSDITTLGVGGLLRNAAMRDVVSRSDIKRSKDH
ncbi:molybdopterin-binding protein (plasmid) [Microvirga terrae]|uniref:Molybdopterin-binding protein n=1 Tax=Microvirga terrae TaxID=2740529 RepID=A0ABY5S0E8_9HYPH|nr:molybdopterin-binding protein [Microvirga terrae]UVF22592.1 molybdopterin-binding protein [Microvirga terrae]